MTRTILFSMLTLLAISCDNNTADNSQKTNPLFDTFKNKHTTSMSTISITAIKGNHIDKASEIFASFRYVDLKNDKPFSTLDSCSSFLSDNYLDYAKKDIAIRGLWFDNGWTIIYDPEMVDFIEDNAMTSISQNLNTDVLTFVVQKTSNTFGFAKYNQQKQRHFLSIDTEIAENFGTPLTEEQGLNLSQSITVNDILQLADKFGVDLEMKNAARPFVAKELGYNDELKMELEKFK
ncbi:MAG: hypothetical protein AB7G44_07610 [Bacteroidia bacterium]